MNKGFYSSDKNQGIRGRGLAAIHDGRLRAELRTVAGHAAVAVALEAHQRTPERSRGRRRRAADIRDVGGAPSPETLGGARGAGSRPTAGL
ncbi:hypothetical protein NDU88_005812 [Pleurodeles waltl]|uniref:Uncharacterized protein n=1 Tax=Pleurodeles waltl TaxID=8319 RepID=A0AAV7QH36_PLEWA|nr:hypothetical protein NDU88_005812 [Pleurodeles waltl]